MLDVDIILALTYNTSNCRVNSPWQIFLIDTYLPYKKRAEITEIQYFTSAPVIP